MSAGIAAAAIVPALLLPFALGTTPANAVGSALPPCTVVGTAGNDRLVGTSGNDVICGRGGDDVLIGRGGHDLLVGGDGDDRLSGGPGDDLLLGGRGHDRLFGGPGRDWLFPLPSIHATEPDYMEMWALDVAAMAGYQT